MLYSTRILKILHYEVDCIDEDSKKYLTGGDGAVAYFARYIVAKIKKFRRDDES